MPCLDDHSSGARRCRTPRATYPGDGPGTPCDALRRIHDAPYSVLLPVGFTLPPRYRRAVGSYPTFSPLPACAEGAGRFAFCGTFPEVALAGRYPAPYLRGARTFLPGGLSAVARSGHPANWPPGMAGLGGRPGQGRETAWRSSRSSVATVESVGDAVDAGGPEMALEGSHHRLGLVHQIRESGSMS